MKIFILLSIVLLTLSSLHAQMSADLTKLMMKSGTPEGMAAYREAIYKKSGIKTSSGDLTSFAKKVKSIKINEDTYDDVISKLGSPMNKSKYMGVTSWNYTFMPDIGSAKYGSGDSTTSVMAIIQFGQDDKVSSVQIFKNAQKGSETVYSAGNIIIPGVSAAQNTNSVGLSDHFPLKDSAPENPTEGQIYFNKSDKHFYGWDGVSWIRLDTKP